MTNYKGFQIDTFGTVTLNNVYINSYDSVGSAKYAIDNEDIQISIANKIAEALEETYDYCTKLEAVKFIKKLYKCFSIEQIVQGWKFAYEE